MTACRLKGRRRLRGQTWKERRHQELHSWDPILEKLVDSYLSWEACRSGESHVPSTTEEGTCPYTVSVFEIFTMQTQLVVLRPDDSTSPPIDLARHGFLTKTAVKPTVAVGFRTLELFHRTRLRKPSLSVEAFMRVICDYYKVRLYCTHCVTRVHTLIFP